MRLYLLRHGETKLNKAGGHFQGQINTPEADLDDEGKRQAVRTRDEFRDRGIGFDTVFSSPQKRAVETARLATGLDPDGFILDDRLMEQNFGPLDGAPWKKMNPSLFHALMHDPVHYFPGAGMESVLHLIQRAGNFIDEAEALAASGKITGDVLVSTHGGTIRAILCHMHVFSADRFWEYPVGNCAWYELSLSDGKLNLTDEHPKA